MPGLSVFTSNRLEILAQQLAHTVRRPLSSPLDKEIIVVQSKGMARWLSMELARLNGICANCFFPFPNSFLNHLCRRLMPDAFESEYFDPENLTFAIMNTLPSDENTTGYETIHAYLSDDDSQMKLMQLSAAIAEIFDQYLIYRTDMIFDWENGSSPADRDQAWQSDLWRRLVSGEKRLHRAGLRQQLFEIIDADPAAVRQLPQRIAAFGISHLPKFHLQILERLAPHAEVNLFLMNPCREYWGDLVSPREAKKIKDAYRHQDIHPEDLHLEHGNRLIASMGTLGRDFFAMIHAMECEPLETVRPAGHGNMLSTLQNDILQLVDAEGSGPAMRDGDGGTGAGAVRPPPVDGSIQFHAAHSPMREVEILYHNLLSMFEASPDLLPKDIVVMTPDIETYAPFIHAVFGTAGEDGGRIPFSVADRNMIAESLVISSFMAILDLKDTRLETFRVLSLLEYPPIREKFGLGEGDMEVIETWVNAVNIRWGRDGESRSRLGLASYAENTWEAGIQRLLLGYAMTGDDRRMFADVLPYDHVEGNETQCLGQFVAFLDRVFQFMDAFDRPKTLEEWSATFLSLAANMLHHDDRSEREFHVLKERMERLKSSQEMTGLKNRIEFNAIRNYLQHAFERESFDAGFISGGVTFCAMLPMRSIPFRVACLIGLNNDSFPRDSRTLSFDLMGRHPLPGDRSRRNDDKYLFLEAILSAREKLYMSFVGQHIQDNSKIMPSVLLSELMEYLQDRFGLPSDQAVVYHPLQAFSKAYFRGQGPLFSYSAENFKAAGYVSQAGAQPGLFESTLSEAADDWRDLDIDRLCRFFVNPAKFILQHRLGIFLDDAKTLPEERENFGLEGLDKFLAAQELIRQRIDGGDLSEVQAILKARGILPYGNVGAYEFKKLVADVEQHVQRLAGVCRDESPRTVELNEKIGDFSIHGSLSNLCGGRMVAHRFAKKNAGEMIRFWIQHLMWCCSQSHADSGESVHLFKDGVVTYQPVENSRRVLAQLLEFFWQGMHRPLPFFPQTAYTYAQHRFERNKSMQESLQQAYREWNGIYGRKESQDPYIAICFTNRDPLDERFVKVSEDIFSAVLTHCSVRFF